MNNLIIALESEGSVSSQKFQAVGYEWKEMRRSSRVMLMIKDFLGREANV